MTGASLAISLLVLYLVWTKIWQPTVLQITKTELTFLHDDIYKHFIYAELELDLPVYTDLQNFIEQSKEYVEKATLTRFFILQYIVKKYPDIMKKDTKLQQQELEQNNEETMRFIQQMRIKCVSIIVCSMLARNFFVVILMIPCLLWVAIRATAIWTYKHVKGCSSSPRYASVFYAVLLAIVYLLPFQKNYDAFEKYITQPTDLYA